MKRLKLLVSAYACNPESSQQLHPGEDLTGWNLVQQLYRFFDLWVITHRYNQKGVQEALGRVSVPEVKYFFIELPHWLKWLYSIEFAQRIYYYLWQIKAWRFACKLHREVGFDAAQHLTFGNYWMPSFIGAFLKVPFIWGPVGGGQKTPRNLLKEYTLYGRLAETFRGLAQWIGIHILVSRRICLKRSKAVLVCNYETRNNIPKKYSEKIFLFPVNGIAPEDLSIGKQRKKSQRPFVVLSAGRLIRLKGFALGLRAFKIFSNKFTDAILEIIGNGPEEANLKELARTLEIQDKVIFLGWLPRRQVLKRLEQSDVFLFPSFRDGGGAVVVEAMASEVPVIVLNSGGPGFHVEGSWGIKIEPRNSGFVIEEMADAMTKLYLDRSLCEQMGRDGRIRAQDYYQWDRLGEKLRGIYEKVLGVH